jgi:hypothetical protein
LSEYDKPPPARVRSCASPQLVAEVLKDFPGINAHVLHAAVAYRQSEGMGTQIRVAANDLGFTFTGV